MSKYEIFLTVTNPTITLSIYLINKAIYYKKATNKAHEIISYILHAVVIGTLVLTIQYPIALLVANMVLMVIIASNYEKNFIKKVTYSGLTYVFLAIIEVTIMLLFQFNYAGPFEEIEFSSITAILLIRLSTLFLSYIVSNFQRHLQKDINLSYKYYSYIILILFSTLYLFLDTIHQEGISNVRIVISASLTVIINLIILRLFEGLYQSFSLKSELEILAVQTKAYENQIGIITQSIQNINSVKHDTKNHFIIIRELNNHQKPEEINEYIESIIQQIDNYTVLSKSNNFIIDSIINLKLSDIPDLDLKLDIKVPEHINILANDLITILGNLLDNSITALKLSPQKHLSIKLRCSKGSLLIFTDNSYSGSQLKPTTQNNFPTTKPDNISHGYGLKNIEKIVLSYDGHISITTHNNTFSTSISLPLP